MLVFTMVVAGGSPLLAQGMGAPVVASLSSSQTLTEGQDVTISVSVNGTAPFTYQWRKGGGAIAGATGSAFAFAPIRVADAGTYTVTIANAVGSVTSGPVVLAVNAAVAPTIYYQPGNVAFTIGDTINLYASVSGTSPMTFVWKRGTTTLAGSTSSSYTKANAGAADAGTYSFTATNIAGSVTSSSFTVSVNPLSPPVFYYGPGNATVETGGYLSLYASVSGGGVVTYQWRKDGVAIAGATSSSYYKSPVTAADAGSYTVVATNGAGSTTSSAAIVTVSAPVAPTVTSISGPVTVMVGDSFSLSVSAYGTGPLSFQWRKDGTAISGATNGYFSKSNVQTGDAGLYSVLVSNAQGSATSGNVTVAISNARPPVINYHPPSFAVRVGAYMYSISVGASGTGTLSYQWSKNGTPIAGAVSSYLNFYRYAAAGDAGTYTVVVSSAQGSATSEPCVLTILPATVPVITQQLPSQTIRQGQAISLYAYAAGVPEPTFQWRKDGVNISGATSASFSKSNVASSDAGIYSFVATNSAGSATSGGATVTVITPSAPRIIGHPASASLLPGEYFYGLYVNVQSAVPYTIQWHRDGIAVPGAVGSNYYISNAQPSIAGTYTAVVTSTAGNVTSRDAVITVDSNVARPVVTYVSGGAAVAGGEGVSLSVSTSGSGESVQWFKDGVIIANATAKNYSFNNFTPGSAGTYTLQVTNASGTFTSRPIVLELLDAGLAPLITMQPVSATVAAGITAGFSVTTEGERPLAYLWRKDGVNIAGAVSSSHYVSPVGAANTGAYSVVVTNRNGSATSSSATLAIAPVTTVPPIITLHPASRTLAASSPYLDLSVSVADAAGCTYQWRKDGVAIAGASGSYYSTSQGAAGRYSVVVTNPAGSATSSDAVVALTTAASGPVFSTQPQNQAAYYGNTVSFTAAATGSPPVAYQWRKNGVAIAGATAATLTLSNVQDSDVATYSALASDTNGATPSAGATLTLSGGVLPFFTAQPSGVTMPAGQAVTFTASASGTPAPTFQWRRSGVPIAGATSATLQLANIQAADAGAYTLAATNPVGSAVSNSATLTVVYVPPVITAQPQSQNLLVGATAVFNVTASGQPSLSYQWRRDGIDVAGATTSSLALSNVQTSAAGRYSVLVRTDFGSVTSADALLTVGNPITVSPPFNTTAFVGSTATLTAFVASVDPLVLRWAKNGTYIPGATSATLTIPNAQLSDSGVYVLTVSRPDGTVIYPLTGSSALFATISVVPRPAPVFVVQPPFLVTASIGSGVSITARAVGTGNVTYQWIKNEQILPGATASSLVIAPVKFSDAADYRVIARDFVGATVSAVARLTVTGSPWAGTYFGNFPDGDGWALHVTADGSTAFVAMLSARGQIVVARNFSIGGDGRFVFGQAQPVAAAGAADYAPRLFTGEIRATIAQGVLTGQIGGTDLVLDGRRNDAPPVTGARAGFYEAVPLASGLGQLAAIVGADGTMLLVAADAAGVRGGLGRLGTDGAFTAQQPGFQFSGSVDGGNLQGTFVPATGAPVSFGAPAPATGTERLINVATRGVTGPGARVLTAGFVVSGAAPKDVLVRAIGPGLTQFGVAGTLGNPRLRLFRGSTPMIDNDDWSLGGFASQIAEASARLGAFTLAPGSLDAAIIARLEPGSYTAQVTVEGTASGVALVEVYDNGSPSSGSPKLVNLSTRGEVGTGGDILIVGIVVNGTAAKKLLIRGIGPALGAFGVSGALNDPRLQLYQGSTLIRENDNWAESTDNAAIAATGVGVGAFALETGSKDSALLLYLAPGSYTAQVSGVGGTTGVALVEIYEVP